MKPTTERKSKTGQRICAATLLLLGAATHAAAETRIRLATQAPRGTSLHQSLQAMAEKWRQAPGGGVRLTIYTDGTMGSEADMVRRMRIGQVQAAMLSVGGLAEIDPAVNALQKMPMAFRSLDELDYVRAKLEPMLAGRLREKGFVVLFWGDAGWVRFFSRTPATRPDDFRKIKMFVGAGDTDQIELMKAARLQPVPLEWSDALTGLQTKMIDAVPTIPFHALAGQYYSVARHMLELNWVPLAGATVITKKAWDSLLPETREAMLVAAAEAGAQIKARTRAESDEAVEAMKKRGLQVHPVPPQLEAEWRNEAEAFYPKIRGRLVPAEMFDEARRLLAEYRETRAEPKSAAPAPQDRPGSATGAKP